MADKPQGDLTVHLNCNKNVSDTDRKRVEEIAQKAGMKFVCSDVGYANEPHNKLEIIVDARTAPRTRNLLEGAEIVDDRNGVRVNISPYWHSAKQAVAEDFANYLQQNGVAAALAAVVKQPTVPVFAELPKGAKIGPNR